MKKMFLLMKFTPTRDPTPGVSFSQNPHKRRHLMTSST